MIAEPAYYLLINNVPHGPYTVAQIRVLIESQSIQANLNSVSFAIAGSSNWQPASAFSALTACHANPVLDTRRGIGTRINEKLKDKSHTLPLLISATCLWLVGRFSASLDTLFFESAAGFGIGFCVASLTRFEYYAVSFFSEGWEVLAFFFCLLVVSCVANKMKPFPVTLSPVLKVLGDRLIAARHQVNLVCGWVVRLTIINAVLLVLLWPCSKLAYLVTAGFERRELFMAAMYGEGTTIFTIRDGIRIFAPNELLDLLRKRMNPNYPRSRGATRFSNIKFNYNRQDRDTYQQWIFDIELGLGDLYRTREHLFLRGNARRDCVDNRWTPWDLILEERPPDEVPVTRPEN